MRLWRNTSIASLGAGPDRHADRRHPRIRVGRGARQRRPAAGADRQLLDHAQRRRCAPGQRLHLRPRHRHPPSDPLPADAPSGRARLRRRHDPVVLGARRQSRSRRLDPRPADAAGDRQPARRHGRPARARCRPAWSAATASTDTDAPSSADHLAAWPAPTSRAARRSRSAAPPRTPRESPAAARSAASRSRPTAAPPGTRRRGATNWTYSWTPGATGSATIKTRAADDSGNLETPGAGVTVNVIARTCPCSIWDDSFTGPQENDPNAVELGVKFRSDEAGFITGLRFYKTAGNTRHPRRPSLDRRRHRADPPGGVTFTGESATGWQEVSFGAPVAIDANTTYVASYHAPQRQLRGHQRLLRRRRLRQPAAARPRRRASTGRTASTSYGAGGVFPTDTFGSSNYLVDVVFENTVGPDTTPPTITARSPASDASGVATDANVTATFNEPMDPTTINGTNFELRDPVERARPRHRHLQRRAEEGDPRPEQRPPELDHLHGDRARAAPAASPTTRAPPTRSPRTRPGPSPPRRPRRLRRTRGRAARSW